MWPLYSGAGGRREADLKAYEREPDPPELKLCRPCSTSDRVTAVHACDGPPCECLICRQIAPVVEEMQEDWKMRDREEGWRL